MFDIAWSHLNWFDGVILGVIGLSILISFFRGFVREFISLVTWVVAIILSIKYALPLGEELSTFIDSAVLRYFIAFGVIFILVLIIGVAINAVLHGFTQESPGFSVVNRLLGVVFGAVRGILVMGMVLLFIHLSALQKSAWYEASQLSPSFKPLTQWLHHFLPQHVQELRNYFNGNSKNN